MIIKSMSRKDASFAQLMEYMESGRADSNYTIYHNLYSRDQDDVTDEFKQNSAYLKRRKNGNYLYHEVISITRSNKISLARQKEKLRDIVYDYVQQRAGKNLAYAAMHDDKEDNLHYHVIISANEVQSKKRFRLTKAKFDGIKKALENRVLENYPELEQKQIINKVASEKLSNKGAEIKRRTGKTPQRDQVKAKLKSIFAYAKNKEELLRAFDKAGLDFYIRGNTPGVKDRQTNRKHRLKTLGFLDEFNEMDNMIKQASSNDDKAQTPKEDKSVQQPPVPNDNDESQFAKVKTAVNEWVFGDFSERDQKAKQDQYDKTKKHMNEDNQTLNTGDKAKEWIMGDFSTRDDIKKAQNINAHYERQQAAKQTEIERRKKEMADKRDKIKQSSSRSNKRGRS